jgi:hypothetical protein
MVQNDAVVRFRQQIHGINFSRVFHHPCSSVFPLRRQGVMRHDWRQTDRESDGSNKADLESAHTETARSYIHTSCSTSRFAVSELDVEELYAASVCAISSV